MYHGSSDVISHDPGTNFVSKEFRNNIQIVGVIYKEMSVEIHWIIDKIECMYRLLKRIYDIF